MVHMVVVQILEDILIANMKASIVRTMGKNLVVMGIQVD